MKRIPRWLLAALALVLATVFALLGSWQANRGSEKAQRLAAQQQAMDAPAPDRLDDALQDAARLPDAVRRVAGFGRFIGPPLLLDNQQRSGRVGLRVYGVAAVDGSPHHVLVDLGWVPMPADRSLPSITEPAGERVLSGLLTPWPGQGLRLGSNPWPATGVPPTQPVLLTYLDADEIARAYAVSLAPALLRLSPDLDYGHARDLDLLSNTLPPERHYGYAVQWYSLSATVLVVLFLMLWRTRRGTSN